MGFVFDQFQTLLQVNRFAARGLFITCLTYHKCCWCKQCSKCEKIGMLKIENYKKKIKYGNKQKTMTKIKKNGKRPGGKDKKEKSKYMWK